MPTARQFLTDALQDMEVLASEAAMTAAEGADGLRVLNRMLGTWTLEGLMGYVVVHHPLALVAGQGSYTVGTGGNWAIARPVAILGAVFHETATGIDTPIRILTEEEYRYIPLKTLESLAPMWLYYEPTFPLAHAIVYPVPTAVNTVVLSVRQPFTSFASLNTSIDFPPGYDEAIHTNLQVRLCPAYGREPSVVTASLAVATKANIKRVNHHTPSMVTDIPGDRSGFSDWTGWLAGEP